MIEAELPRNEDQRLEALACLGLLDTAPEYRFDHIVAMAKELFGVPIVLISLVDQGRQWFKSKTGMEATETPRSVSFCAHALTNDSPVIVEDTHQDPRFSDNPLVSGDLNLRFYAGYPIHSPEGYPLGTLCLIDHTPRSFHKTDLRLLQLLAELVDKEIASSHLLTSRPTSSASESVGDLLQKLGSYISRKSISVFLALLVFACLMVFLSLEQVQGLQAKHFEQQTATANTLSNIRGRLETELNARLHLTQGLAGLVRAAPGNIDQETFLSFARDLGNNLTGIRSLQLAPDGIVQYLWPEETNSPALGHDLLADPARRVVAEKAIDSRQLWIAGPLTLIQGGTALIGRLPVFLPVDGVGSDIQPEAFWGFATVLVDLDTLLTVADFEELSDGFEVAIRGRNGLGKHGEVFVGSETVFEGRHQSATVSMPAGSWEVGMAVSAPPTVADVPAGRWVLIIAGACFVSGLIYMLLRLPFRYLQAVDAAKQALAVSNARFKDAIEALPDGFAVFDESDRLVRCNQRYREFFSPNGGPIPLGLTFEDVLKESIDANVYDLPTDQTDSDAARDRFKAMRLSHHQTPTPEGLELSLANGRWLRAVESRVPSGGTVIAYTDVSELKKKEHELASEKLKAESANEAKTAFLATVSHELRTPLNAILGMVNLIQLSGRLEPKDQDYIDLAHDSAEHLLNLLNELLDLSKMEANKLELEKNDFNLGEVVRKTLKLCGNKARQKNIDLIANLDPDTDVMVRGDAGRLQQILLNLLLNGIKFTDQGSVSLVITRENSLEQCSLFRFQVEDTGIGFTDAQAKTLFQPFLQLDSTASRKHEGTGLGLVICKRLAELMGGQINASGKPGEGAVFTLLIPFEKSLATIQPETEADRPEETPSSLSQPPVRVLIAEDSPANQIVFKAMLENTGYYADVVGNGLEAVQASKDFNYDIILMDIFMPEMDGIEATQAIREVPSTQGIPIIALTANAMPGDQDRFLKAGMDDYIAKPVNKGTLLKMLRKYSS
jgi:signal transduction histidine kinase/sensor domain CHASE-containing protein/CheY-like chemotaxis protein